MIGKSPFKKYPKIHKKVSKTKLLSLKAVLSQKSTKINISEKFNSAEMLYVEVFEASKTSLQTIRRCSNHRNYRNSSKAVLPDYHLKNEMFDSLSKKCEDIDKMTLTSVDFNLLIGGSMWFQGFVELKNGNLISINISYRMLRIISWSFNWQKTA